MIVAFSYLVKGFIEVVDFVAGLLLVFIAALMYALPWLLRGLSVIGWLASAFIAIQTISAIYSPFSDEIPVFALQFMVIVLMVLWAMVGLMNQKDVWGLLAAGGAVMYGVSRGATWLMSNWQYADLFFRVLPVTMLAVGMITISIRTRTRRMSRVTNANITPISEEAVTA